MPLTEAQRARAAESMERSRARKKLLRAGQPIPPELALRKGTLRPCPTAAEERALHAARERRRRARNKLIAEGRPVPPELALRKSGSPRTTKTPEEIRKAQREYKRAYEAKNAAKVAAQKQARAERNRILLYSIKANPCLDCGEHFPPVCMDFDHREGLKEPGGRKNHIGYIVNRGLGVETILDEVAKCDLVCANCHRLRTASRADWDRRLRTHPISRELIDPFAARIAASADMSLASARRASRPTENDVEELASAA